MIGLVLVSASSDVSWATVLLQAFLILAVVAVARGARPIVIGLVVALVLATGAVSAMALPYPCPMLWKYLGLCG